MSEQDSVEVLVIGAGMSGLSAAADLVRAGREVLVIDKGRGLGGRLSNRRLSDAIAEHGAQFVTARTPRFKTLIDHWMSAGIVREWWRSDADEESTGYPRYCGIPTMSQMAKELAKGLTVRSGQRAVTVKQQDGRWITTLESGVEISSEKIIITAPVPQTLELLKAGGITMTDNVRQQLEAIEYEPCIAVMAALSNETEIPQNGALPITHGPIAWIGDNQAKGVSNEPAITIHASAAFSQEHWHRDRLTVGRELLDSAEQLLGAAVVDYQVHGWLYSKPVTTESEQALLVSEAPVMVLAGDAFGGPKIEGAVLSGWAAAEILLNKP